MQLEKHLHGLMKSYDECIGERSLKLYDSEKLLERESQVLIEWKQKFESLDIVYKNIVDMKATVDKKQREARLLLYMMNNAARTIQRFYRNILANRQQKRKKSKKNKKTKAK